MCKSCAKTVQSVWETQKTEHILYTDNTSNQLGCCISSHYPPVVPHQNTPFFPPKIYRNQGVMKHFSTLYTGPITSTINQK